MIMSEIRKHRILTRLCCAVLALALITFAPPGPSYAAGSTTDAYVTFSAGGGKPAPAKLTVAIGSTVQKPQTDLAKAGYSFTGWYTASEKTTLCDFSADVPGSMTLYAGWEKLPKVTFMSGGGKVVGDKSAPKPLVVEPDMQTIPLPEVTKAGCAFEGWYLDKDCTQAFLTQKPVTESIKVYAKWRKLPVVTFTGAGSKGGPGKLTVEKGSTVEKPADPTKNGYVFDGWYTDSKKTKLFDFSTKIEESLKLYAKWYPTPTVTFAVVGGKPAPEKQSIDPGDSAETPKTEPTKAGYTFNGWYASSRYTEKFDFDSPVKGKATAYAKWVRNPIVSFSTKGKATAPPKQELKPNEQAKQPEVSAPGGYTLEGWYTDSACYKKFDFNKSVETSMTLYANWVRTD